MSGRIEYYGKSGQRLKYSVCKPDGTPKGAPLHPLPESQTPGYYTAISHTNLEKNDKVVIYGPENVLYEGELLTYEGDFVTVDETVGKGEFSEEAHAFASTEQNDGKNIKQRKYSADFLKRVQAIFEQRRDNGMDVKGAWNEAADAFQIKSGKAAEMACRRYLKKQNK